MPGKLNSIEKAQQALTLAWPSIKKECLSVLGSELHYQAMVYHCLRNNGDVPASQLGMNVKMWIDNPTTKLFKKLDKRKLQPGEIIKDLEKLAAYKKEVKNRGSNMFPVMIVVDSAPLEAERMTSYGIETFVNRASQLKVGVLYCSPTTEINTI